VIRWLWIWLAAPCLACSGEVGPRIAYLDSERASGLNRICVYSDLGSEYIVTVPMWERCPFTLELE
jgi:hypothetical protein